MTKKEETKVPSKAVAEVEYTLEQYEQRFSPNVGTVASMKYEAGKPMDARSKSDWDAAIEAQSNKQYK